MEKTDTYLFETLQTPVRGEYDVIVAGGGTAGIVATIASARNGARTALVEREMFLGGTLLGGGIKWMSFFNAYLAHDIEKKQCVGGIGQEMVDRMIAEGGGPGHIEEKINFGHESVGTQVDRELLMKVLLEMAEESGVSLFLNTMAVSTVKTDNRITGILIESKSGREALLAKCVVDCTGDGDIAALAGAAFENCSDQLGVGLLFGMGNVDLNRAVQYASEQKILSHLGLGDKGSERDHVIWAAIDLYKDPHFSDFMKKYGIWGPYISSTHEDEATYINGLTTTVTRENSANPDAEGLAEARPPFCNLNGLDARALSECEVYLRKKVFEWAEMLKQFLPGFERAHVSWTAPDLGVRRTRQIACEYAIADRDVAEGVIPEDRIGIFGGNDANYYGSTIREGGWFGIPYRSLIPKSVDGLFVAGRMITSDWTAHMSTRLVGACFVTGQAAGTAAALCAAENILPRAVPVDQLQDVLRRNGAILE